MEQPPVVAQLDFEHDEGLRADPEADEALRGRLDAAVSEAAAVEAVPTAARVLFLEPLRNVDTAAAHVWVAERLKGPVEGALLHVPAHRGVLDYRFAAATAARLLRRLLARLGGVLYDGLMLLLHLLSRIVELLRLAWKF